MNERCFGCGTKFQTTEKGKEGYVPIWNEKTTLCERCFRIQHYQDYQILDKTNQDFYPILEKIAQTKKLVLFVLDLFSLPKDLSYFHLLKEQNVIFVLTKRDLLPKSTYEKNLLAFLDTYQFPYVASCLVSAKKNYQFDLLYQLIKQYQTSPEVFVIGYTNAGKSTLINRFLQNYGERQQTLTTSIFPSTTLDQNPIYVNDEITLMDTPGILETNSLVSKVEIRDLKKITPLHEIRPIVFQMKANQYLQIENFAYILVEKSLNVTCYVSNNIKIQRRFQLLDPTRLEHQDLQKWTLEVPDKSDIVILGLGFLHCRQATFLTLYVTRGVDVFIRKSLVGGK